LNSRWRVADQAGRQIEQQLIDQPSRSSEPLSLKPASACTSLMPRRASSAQQALPDRPCRRVGQDEHSAPAARSICDFFRRLARGGDQDRAALQDAGCVERRLQLAVDHDAQRLAGRFDTSRTLSCGSSSRTVPMPVRMAQARARQRGRRAAHPGR
jgi:hypothetical protein